MVTRLRGTARRPLDAEIGPAFGVRRRSGFEPRRHRRMPPRPRFSRRTAWPSSGKEIDMSDSRNATGALGRVVVVLFENRSFDNMLGHLYGPDDGKTFEGVIGKQLRNPIPEWAEHDAGRKDVPYSVATDMDAPNPDSGEEWYHTNTQLYG